MGLNTVFLDVMSVKGFGMLIVGFLDFIVAVPGFIIAILLLIVLIKTKKNFEEGKIPYEDLKKAKIMNAVFDTIYVIFIIVSLISMGPLLRKF
jgi:ABC-type dipeptide/oligopeptide/nickel transport system permease subunit